MHKRLIVLFHLSHVTLTESCMWRFGGKPWRKETTLKTLAQRGG